MPIGSFGDAYMNGFGGTAGLGIRNGQWRFALNGGYASHDQRNLPGGNEAFIDYGLLNLSADYQLLESKLSPLVGLSLGLAGATGQRELNGIQVPGSEFRETMATIAPMLGARWQMSDRVSLDLFTMFNLFLNAPRNITSGTERSAVTIPVGLGLNIDLGDAESKPSTVSDRDGDGIADKDDRCPDEVGLKMYKGCPEVPAAEVKSLEDKLNSIAKKVLFATSSAVIEPGSFRDLDDLAKIMQKYPNTRFAIEGHTDNTGNADANKKLSQERADAVKAYLSGKGIEPSRLTATGYGQERAIGSNDTDEGRSINRRVEIHLIK